MRSENDCFSSFSLLEMRITSIVFSFRFGLTTQSDLQGATKIEQRRNGCGENNNHARPCAVGTGSYDLQEKKKNILRLIGHFGLFREIH